MRLAATVMLARPTEGGTSFEVFMLRRSAESAFAPDVYVFPGGTLDAQDFSEETLARARGLEPERLRGEYRVEEPAALPSSVERPSQNEVAGLYLAALRELFEEAGVLLACDAAGQPIAQAAIATQAGRLDGARVSMRSGASTFCNLLRTLDVFADARALSLFSQWITPPSEGRRYNTHFFVAQAAPGQIAIADAQETHDGVWIAPQDALDRMGAGTFRMVYPTIKHIERLARFATVRDLLVFTRAKPIYRIVPWGTPADGFALPPELEYAW